MAKGKGASRTAQRRGAFKPTARVTFRYIKSGFHRVITANGIHGGPTPNGKMIAMSLFNERQPIPQEEVYGVDKNGKLTERPLQRTQEGDIIREVETTVLMEPQVAARIRDWLDAMIRAVPNQTGQKP